MDDVRSWRDDKEFRITQVYPAMPEYVEYATQKPEKLLQRIIEASCSE